MLDGDSYLFSNRKHQRSLTRGGCSNSPCERERQKQRTWRRLCQQVVKPEHYHHQASLGVKLYWTWWRTWPGPPPWWGWARTSWRCRTSSSPLRLAIPRSSGFSQVILVVVMVMWCRYKLMERKVKIAVRLRDRAGYHEALAELKAALEDATLDQVMRIFHSDFIFGSWNLPFPSTRFQLLLSRT